MCGRMCSTLPRIFFFFFLVLFCRSAPVHHCEKGEKPCGDLVDKCVSEDQICDGFNHCPNEFDEMNCADDLPTFEEFMEMDHLHCASDEFKCSNGKCIALDVVCNGELNCKHGEDEGPLCAKCEGYGCGGTCQNLPTGPVCGCPPGMFLSVDGKTCEHEELCMLDGGHNCSHHCYQSHNHVTCSCAPGYNLVGGFDCVVGANDRNGALFVVNNDSVIRRIPLFDNSTAADITMPSSIKKISSLSFNAANKNLYFVAEEDRHTKIYTNNGKESKPLYFGLGLKHIAVDWITNNVYYAADGFGIGVCRADGRYCYHLITGHEPIKGEKTTQTYGDLIVHPKRGLLIWADYSIEHPNGALMVAGMDGKKQRSLLLLSSKRLSAMAMDYVMDHLFYIHGEDLILLDMHTLKTHTVASGVMKPYSMIMFNEYLYYVSKSSLALMKHKINEGESAFVHGSFVGQFFSMSINNSLYYDSFVDPCEKMNCSHMCVLKELPGGGDKIPLAKCVCPDMYLKDANGACVFNTKMNTQGPVRTSAGNMETMCADRIACLNDGECPEKQSNDDSTPFCTCPRGFNGLYCELKSSESMEDEEASSSWAMVLFMLFMLVLIAIAVAFCVLKMHPTMRHRFESFSNINVSPHIDRIRSRAGASIRPKDTSATPMLSRNSSSTTFSPSPSTALLRSGEQPPRPIQLTNSFSNPSFVTGVASQQRLDEELLERDIQVNCAAASATTGHK